MADEHPVPPVTTTAPLGASKHHESNEDLSHAPNNDGRYSVSFLTLSFEIRSQIYRYMYQAREFHIGTVRLTSQSHYQDIGGRMLAREYPSDDPDTPSVSTDIINTLLASHQVYEEAASAVYSRASFVFGDLLDFARFEKYVRPRFKRQIRRLHIKGAYVTHFRKSLPTILWTWEYIIRKRIMKRFHSLRHLVIDLTLLTAANGSVDDGTLDMSQSRKLATTRFIGELREHVLEVTVHASACYPTGDENGWSYDDATEHFLEPFLRGLEFMGFYKEAA